MAATPIPSHRILLKETEIVSLIEVLRYHKSQFGLPQESQDALAKLTIASVKIDVGAKVPDYIPVANPMDRRKVNLDSLGATSEEKEYAHLSMEEQEDELERLNRIMLEELAAEGNSNVVLEERRTQDRSEERVGVTVLFEELADNTPSDADLFKML